MTKTNENKTHFYERGEFYIALGAFVISLISLYFSYLASPLSDVMRPLITYKTYSQIQDAKGEKFLMLGCEIQNPSNNPAEDVVVSLPLPATSEVKVFGGLEYSVIKTSEHLTSVKFPLVPPHSQVSVTATASAEIAPGLVKDVLRFIEVQHKHGQGIEIPSPEK